MLCCCVQLNVSSNGLHDLPIIHLARALEKNKSLTELDISYNLWEDTGAAAVGKLLVRAVCCQRKAADSFRLRDLLWHGYVVSCPKGVAQRCEMC